MVHFIQPQELKELLDTLNNVILCNFTNMMTQKSIIKSLPKMKLPSLLFKNVIKKNIDINSIYAGIEFIQLHQRNALSYIVIYDDNTSFDNFKSFEQIGYFYNYFLVNENMKVSILSGGLDNWIKHNYEVINPLFLDSDTSFDCTGLSPSITLLPDDISDTWINNFIKISGCCFLNETLKSKGIKYVLNVSQTPSLQYSDIIHLDIPMMDDKTQNILLHLPKAFEFIDYVNDNNGKILVHCQAGISRSVSIVMAWIIWKQKITVDETFEIIKLHRPQASPNLNFWIQLNKFYTTMKTNPDISINKIVEIVNLV